MNSLLAVCFLLQAQSAEDSFKKIEETFKAAKCVRVTFAWDGAMKEDEHDKVDATGSVLLKDGNRASLRASFTANDKSSELNIISDGKTVKSRLGPQRLLECAVPHHLGSGLRMTVLRLGALQAVLVGHKICSLDAAEQDEVLDLDNMPPLSDFRQGPDDGDSKTMTYRIPQEPAECAAEVKLWYVPETYRLVKRKIMVKLPAESVFTETYREWTVGGKLGNEEFILPSVK